MIRKRIGGTLSATAMKALSALRRTDIVDGIEARPDRPCDRIDFVIEARRLIAAGATIADVAYALDVTTKFVRMLIGPVKGRSSGARTAAATRKGP